MTFGHLARLGAVFLLAGLSTATVQAKPISIAVRYNDLDLNRDEGATALLARLFHASVAACGGETTLATIGLQGALHACVARAEAGAVASLGKPLVTRIYRGSSPR